MFVTKSPDCWSVLHSPVLVHSIECSELDGVSCALRVITNQLNYQWWSISLVGGLRPGICHAMLSFTLFSKIFSLFCLCLDCVQQCWLEQWILARAQSPECLYWNHSQHQTFCLHWQPVFQYVSMFCWNSYADMIPIQSLPWESSSPPSVMLLEALLSRLVCKPVKKAGESEWLSWSQPSLVLLETYDRLKSLALEQSWTISTSPSTVVKTRLSDKSGHRVLPWHVSWDFFLM